jgi:hypothetical protein
MLEQGQNEAVENKEKRTVQVNVKMGEADFKLLHRAAERIWPGAVLSNSGILLGLARIAAKDLLDKKPKKQD